MAEITIGMNPYMRRWFKLGGVIALIGGFLALVFPFIATLTTTVFVGITFLIGAIGYLTDAWIYRHQAGLWFRILTGLLLGVAGVYLVLYPLMGAFSLTLLLVVVLAMQGVLELMGAMTLWDYRGSGWLAVSGVISMLLAALITYYLPSAALWSIGVIMGVNLISSGLAALALSSEVQAPRYA